MSTRMPIARARHHVQTQRVQHGVQSGQITKKEAQALKESNQAIKDMVHDAKADGKVTLQERQEIQQALNQQSRDIFEAKHNDQTRDKTPRVDKRQARQTGRIADGVLSGELTKSELKDIRASRKDIREAERAAKADGVVTKEERQELHSMLNDLSQDIFEAKHNKSKRRRNVFV